MQPRPLRFLSAVVLAACLCSAPARAESSAPEHTPELGSLPAASTPKPTGPGTPAQASPLQEAPPLPVLPVTPAAESVPDTSLKKKMAGALGRTADQTHDYLERGILQQVVNLDDFFGKANSQQELHTAYLLRWRNSLRLQQGGGLNFGSTLRANVELSRINERLQLSISGEDKPDSFAPSLPEDPGNPGFDRTFRTARFVNTELRYQLIRSPVTDFFLGAGVNLVLPPEVFARARYQRTERLSDLFLVRFAETLFAKTPDGIGETTELSLEHSLNPKTLLRWASSGTVSQEIGALEWGSELSLLRELSPRSAVTLTGGVYGNTGFQDWINNYRVLVRYRRNFLRSWLFYELEPQVDWPRRASGSFPANYAFTGRIEIVFQGQERRTIDKP